jgi:hypothetical protein
MALIAITGPSIPAGQTDSDAVDCSAGTIVRITMPSDWSPKVNLSLSASPDGKAWFPVYGPRGEVLIPVTPNADVAMPLDLMRGIHFMKFHSGRLASRQPQVAARQFAITLETVPLGGTSGIQAFQ